VDTPGRAPGGECARGGGSAEAEAEPVLFGLVVEGREVEVCRMNITKFKGVQVLKTPEVCEICEILIIESDI